jgi:hypothetical protein
VSSETHKNEMKPEIDLLVDFVNSRDVEEDTDAIAEPSQLAEWIGEHTGERLPELQPDDVQRIQRLRESLRALMHSNNGGRLEEADLAPLREAAERSRFRLALEHLQCDELWPRLKACTDDGCQWAFYDTTRNRSRTWCSMDVCGNREKTRRYRRRKASR